MIPHGTLGNTGDSDTTLEAYLEDSDSIYVDNRILRLTVTNTSLQILAKLIQDRVGIKCHLTESPGLPPYQNHIGMQITTFF